MGKYFALSGLCVLLFSIRWALPIAMSFRPFRALCLAVFHPMGVAHRYELSPFQDNNKLELP
jgi:hypothetical protein